MGREDNVIVGVSATILEMKENSSRWVIRYRFDSGVEEEVVWWESFHDCVNVPFRTVLGS